MSRAEWLKDDRSLWAKLFKANPNFKDLTAKGRLLNFTGRMILIALWILGLPFASTKGWVAFFIYFVIYFLIGSAVIYLIDQYTCTFFTHTANAREIENEAKAVTKEIPSSK